MKKSEVVFSKDFEVITGNKFSQSAVMVLASGKTEGGADNKHENSDQWLFVISGTGVAIINGKETELKPNTLVLIEKGEIHEIKNSGKEELKTLNFYVPPEY